MNESVGNKGVCRTAMVTLGLLNMRGESQLYDTVQCGVDNYAWEQEGAKPLNKGVGIKEIYILLECGLLYANLSQYFLIRWLSMKAKHYHWNRASR